MYEIYNDGSNSEEWAEIEMMIAVNGPKIETAEIIINDSIKKYFKKSGKGNKTDWHFVCCSYKIMDSNVSNIFELMKIKARIVFYDER